MKNVRLKYASIAFATLIMLGACNGNQQEKHNHAQMEEDPNDTEDTMHEQHESIRDNFVHQDIIILEDSYKVETAVSLQLKEVVNAYLEMKNALVNDNATEVDKVVAKMTQKILEVDGSSLQGEGASTWQQHASLYSEKLTELKHSEGIDEKRSYFSHISEIIYCTVKSFDFKEDMELYAIYCPMAFDGKGAYWIAETKEINNPYFGSKMLKCGEIKEIL